MPISEIGPDFFTRMVQLKTFRIARNRLASLPASVAQRSTRFLEFDVSENPMDRPIQTMDDFMFFEYRVPSLQEVCFRHGAWTFHHSQLACRVFTRCRIEVEQPLWLQRYVCSHSRITVM
jgi:hypothetical protein